MPDSNDLDTLIPIVVHLKENTDLTRRQIAELLFISERQVKRYLELFRAGKRQPPDGYDWRIDALLNHAAMGQALYAMIDPVITHKTIRIETDGPVAVMLAGCFQLGGRWTFHGALQGPLRDILSHPSMRVGLFGDEIENFHHRSFAGARSANQQALQPELQRSLWRLFLNEIKDRALWGLGSQHGSQWDAKLGFSPIKQAYLDYGIPFFDGMGYVKLQVGEQEYNLAIAHEFPGNSMYNKNHPQKRALWQRYPNADLIAQADKHTYSYTEESHYGNEMIAGNRKSDIVHLLQIGTLKIGPDPYTVKGWERGSFIWPFAIFYPDRHQIKVTREWEDARAWIEV